MRKGFLAVENSVADDPAVLGDVCEGGGARKAHSAGDSAAVVDVEVHVFGDFAADRDGDHLADGLEGSVVGFVAPGGEVLTATEALELFALVAFLEEDALDEFLLRAVPRRLVAGFDEGGFVLERSGGVTERLGDVKERFLVLMFLLTTGKFLLFGLLCFFLLFFFFNNFFNSFNGRGRRSGRSRNLSFDSFTFLFHRNVRRVDGGVCVVGDSCGELKLIKIFEIFNRLIVAESSKTL